MKPLKLSSIHHAIDEATDNDGTIQQEFKQKGMSLRRASEPSDWQVIFGLISKPDGAEELSAPSLTLPRHLGITVRKAETDELCGFLTFYMAYSSWDGRILYVDRLECSYMDDATEILFLRTLAEVAVKLDCARLTWRHKDTPSWHSTGGNRPEIHKEVLTLSMDRDAIEKYVSASVSGKEETRVWNGPFDKNLVQGAVHACLSIMNKASDSKFQLRLATENDLGTIVRLVQGLADYVKEPDSVNITASDYILDGFGDDPLFYCLLVDHIDEKGSVYTCGYAFCYIGYILGEGRFLYLEDLYLEVDYRKNGGGNLVMQSLSRICQALQCARLYWQALDWNTAGLAFYNKIGAKIHDGEQTFRYSGDSLKSFAEAQEPQ